LAIFHRFNHMLTIRLTRTWQLPGWIAFAALVQGTTAWANSQLPLEPGYWKMVTRPELNGAPMVATPKTSWLCLKTEDIQAGNIPIPMLPACQVASGKWNGTQLELTFKCKELPTPMALKGTLNAASRSYQGRIDLAIDPDEQGEGRGKAAYIFSASWQAEACPLPATTP